MKCIKTIKKTNSREIGEVIRTEEKDADNKVNTGFWAYCPKSEWKAERRPAPKVEEVIVEVQEKTIAEKQLSKKKKDK